MTTIRTLRTASSQRLVAPPPASTRPSGAGTSPEADTDRIPSQVCAGGRGDPCGPGTVAAAGSPRREPVGERITRRLLDVVVSALVLGVLMPVWVAIGLWVRRDSPGPALLRQERVGLGRRPFTFYKFRTMRIGGDDLAHRLLIEAELRGEDTVRSGSTKLDADARITPSGRFLRRTSLDEIPQLINVLRGDMSLVGPRPCLPWEAEMFGVEHAERFTVRPGITGLWQVNGRSTVGTLDMLRWDVEYVRTRSIGLDVRILLRTVPTLVRGDGAR
ncbi:sugar transferase [Geodermatophilus sp. SYSU D00965]